MFHRFLHDESGSTAIEYALVASLISVAILTALHTLSENTEATYEQIARATAQANEGGGGGGGGGRP